MHFRSFIAFFGLVLSSAFGSEWFVATDGADSNAGTKEKPFASVQRAQKDAQPGDTVFIRGGIYKMSEAGIGRRNRFHAYITYLDKSGKPGAPIRYWALPGEQPVFDCSAVKPAGLRVSAFYTPASWIHFKGIEVTGVQVTARGHTQSICFYNDGDHNIYELLSMHDGQAIGIYNVRGSDNLFLNCDAFRNHDYTSENGKGGNVDGFGSHAPEGGKGNIFRGCRAWLNSDDGFDLIGSANSVIIENCWAFQNGLSADGKRLADGNGFKAGGHAATPVERLPNPIPRHIIRDCLAVGNRSSGFYANHHIGGSEWTSNTAFRNGVNFNMLNRLPNNETDVPGYDHKLRNNLGYKGGKELANLDRGKSDSKENSFDLELKITDADFVSLDEKQLLQPRQKNGDLPKIDFMRVREKSPLIIAGKALGRPTP